MNKRGRDRNKKKKMYIVHGTFGENRGSWHSALQRALEILFFCDLSLLHFTIWLATFYVLMARSRYVHCQIVQLIGKFFFLFHQF